MMSQPQLSFFFNTGLSVVVRHFEGMCAQECMHAPLLSHPHPPTSEPEPDTAEDLICEGCLSDMSTAPSQGPGAPLCSIRERSEPSEPSVPSASSLDSDDFMRLDGQVPFAPDADADVCAACQLTYAAAAASFGALVSSVAFAAGACCARVGGRLRAGCLSGAVGPFVP